MTILFLTYYFEPDLCAGSFRNSALVAELSRQLTADDRLHVVTTQPNRYQSFYRLAPAHEERGNLVIDRISVPAHANGFRDQIWSFGAYYRAARQLTKVHDYDVVIASSSRLFTAFLGARLARSRRIPLLLDIRDLFRETIVELLGHPLSWPLNPVLWAVERYTFGYARHINLVSEGFTSYFGRYRQASYSFYTNGIDREFMPTNNPVTPAPDATRPVTILYAGNIGAGQRLEIIVPQAAWLLGNRFRFVVIGDGSRLSALEAAVRDWGLKNVELRPPVDRKTLLAEYQRADYLFVHLSNLRALKRVLPSKLFEYGATDKPILAGVGGYAARFVRLHLSNYRLFSPGNVAELVTQLQQTPYQTQYRPDFIRQFSRQQIMVELARCLLEAATDRKPVSRAASTTTV
ncbi:glycosyltransferase family 4 protein [Spirosoma sordidisoli]|uniref:Glycosyltransferase WbuB n=1 Tax=Spirosoma sordidisoli TaxID=2502893 RepID=A0A4Q2URB9_9BACT|nr:glycosyltransferase family 4 protein [Spirosoma sordidisoli]RYC72094.1 glycosyltransferase WbuB [Spirosoma sordidisoli]